LALLFFPIRSLAHGDTTFEKKEVRRLGRFWNPVPDGPKYNLGWFLPAPEFGAVDYPIEQIQCHDCRQGQAETRTREIIKIKSTDYHLG
jgi:hypothetical protein